MYKKKIRLKKKAIAVIFTLFLFTFSILFTYSQNNKAKNNINTEKKQIHTKKELIIEENEIIEELIKMRKQQMEQEQEKKQKEIIKNPTTKEEKLEYLENIHEKLDFFNFDYLDRYVNYKKEHPNYSTEVDIVDVNLGFDYDFYDNVRETQYSNTSYVLVNKYNYLKNSFVPDSLETISEKYAVSGMKLVSYAKEAFEEMAKAAKEDGYTIRAMSTYRSYDYQKDLYNRYVKQDGKAKADTYSARPGYSEHQTGLAADIDNGKTSYTNFEKTKEYKWMQDHAHEYGFILRYPKNKEGVTGYSYESWHYRYVGVEVAKYIHESGMSYDEYYVRFIENKK